MQFYMWSILNQPLIHWDNGRKVQITEVSVVEVCQYKSELARCSLNFMLRYQRLIEIKVNGGNVTGVKRQLVILYYHSVKQSDENVDMALIIMSSKADIAFH